MNSALNDNTVSMNHSSSGLCTVLQCTYTETDIQFIQAVELNKENVECFIDIRKWNDYKLFNAMMNRNEMFIRSKTHSHISPRCGRDLQIKSCSLFMFIILFPLILHYPGYWNEFPFCVDISLVQLIKFKWLTERFSLSLVQNPFIIIIISSLSRILLTISPNFIHIFSLPHHLLWAVSC